MIILHISFVLRPQFSLICIQEEIYKGFIPI